MIILGQEDAIVAIDSVRPHPQNPRRGDVGLIQESIKANGFYGALVIQKASGYILAGSHRWLAAVQSGAKEVPVKFIDVDDGAPIRRPLQASG